MKKLLLIDGNSIMNRGFYALPPDLTNKDGLHTNALLGFLNIFFRIYEEEHPTNICVAFDVHSPTFRHELFKDYKGTRHGMPEELKEQMPVIKELLHTMKIPTMELAGYEADDLLGTMSRKGEEAGMEVTILSGDRDLLQLATENVMIRIPKTRAGKTTVEDYHAAEVQSVYGVTPVEFIEMKGLMGDTSDNIPGVPGIGPKTAEKLIRTYHTVEAVLEHLEDLPKNKMRAALEENRELAVFSRDLSRILLTAPLTVEVSDTTVLRSDIFSDAVRERFLDLEMKSLLKHFMDDSLDQPKGPRFEMEVRDGKLSEVKAFTSPGSVVGFYPVFAGNTLLGTAFSIGGNVILTETDAVASVYELLSWMRTNDVTISVPSLKPLIRPFHITEEEKWFNIEVAAYLLDPLAGEYPYHTLLQKYMGFEVKSEKDLVGKQERNVFSFAVPEMRESFAMWAYTAELLCPVLMEQLEKADMMTLYRTMEHPATFVLQDMEQYGIRVDRDALQKYGIRLDSRIDVLTKEIYEDAGEEFNINSPKQLGQILFEKLNLPSGKKTKSGYSTNVDVLIKLQNVHPIAKRILEFRQLTKLRSTYVDGLMAAIAPDGRIHSRFHQTVTATGRISSAEPNLQNIPMRTELGRELRKVFIPEDGFVFVDADYSQIELRVMAAMSGDENLIEAFRKAQDIHAATASKVFHVPLDQVDSGLRRKAKAVNFGIIYGISSFGLGQDLDISRQEAQEYIDQYFETYRGVKSFLDLLVETGKASGAVRTLYKRIRPIPELKSSNFMTRQFGERVAMNSPIQGTAADIIKLAMIAVREELLSRGMRSRLILQIHDELLIEAAKEEVEDVCRILEDKMVHAADLAVPLYIDMRTGANLYDTK